MLLAVAMRERISARVAEALIARGRRAVTLKLLRRADVPVPLPTCFRRLADEHGADDAEIRGALLARDDLPGAARLLLVEAVGRGAPRRPHRQGRGRAASGSTGSCATPPTRR